MPKLTRIFVLLFILISNLNAADKNDIFNKLISQIDDSERLSLVYSGNNSDENVGSIYIEKNNKYRIKIGQRIISCDGKTVWNYDLENKKVVITNYENDESQISIPNILFNLKNNYKPISLKKNHQSFGAKIVWILRLISEADDSEIELILDQNHTLKHITFSTEEIVESWKIKSLHFNPPKLKLLKLVNDSEFDKIDLR